MTGEPLPVKPQAEPRGNTGTGPDALIAEQWGRITALEAERDAAVELLRRWLRVNELPGTRTEIAPEIEKARSASYAFLAAQAGDEDA